MAEKAPKLTDQELTAELQKLEGWQLVDGQIVRTFRFVDFVTAIRFVNDAAKLAEDAGHHPDLDIRYNQVRASLVTHDSGGVTSKDTHLAEQLNQAADR